jgi:hypothetical protein
MRQYQTLLVFLTAVRDINAAKKKRGWIFIEESEEKKGIKAISDR